MAAQDALCGTLYHGVNWIRGLINACVGCSHARLWYSRCVLTASTCPVWQILDRWERQGHAQQAHLAHAAPG